MFVAMAHFKILRMLKAMIIGCTAQTNHVKTMMAKA
jgi:hypothetical protein